MEISGSVILQANTMLLKAWFLSCKEACLPSGHTPQWKVGNKPSVLNFPKHQQLAGVLYQAFSPLHIAGSPGRAWEALGSSHVGGKPAGTEVAAWHANAFLKVITQSGEEKQLPTLFPHPQEQQGCKRQQQHSPWVFAVHRLSRTLAGPCSQSCTTLSFRIFF